MRMIVDSNYLRDEQLRFYLESKATNIAILSDQVTLEIHKSGNLESVSRSLDILSSFPRQVKVLKSYGDLSKLSGRSKGLARRLICEKSTQWFAQSCNDLAEALQGNRKIAKLFELRHRMAAHYMNDLLDGVPSILRDASRFKTAFNDQELNIIRTDKEYTEEIFLKLVAIADDIHRRLMGASKFAIKPPTLRELPNTFLYRLSLALTLNYLRWEEVGGPHPAVDPKKIRNDFVDMKIAAYASYFDGILSHDQKLCELFTKLDFVIAILIRNVELSQRHQ